jgi:hypothetical protein
MPAIHAFSQQGNGEHHWLAELIAKVQQLTRQLRDVVPRIGIVTDPSERDVGAALECVGQVLSLIVGEVIPARHVISQVVSARSLRDVEQAISSLEVEAQNALVIIDTYAKTLRNEQRQRNKVRPNKRFSDDQQALHRLRIQSNGQLSLLVAALDSFVRTLSRP